MRLQKKCILLQVTKSLVFTMNLPNNLLGDVTLAAVYCINRTQLKILNNQSPPEALKDKG